MKNILFTLFTSLSFFYCTAQNTSFNQGGTTQKNYFSPIKFENIAGFIIVKATIKGDTYRFILDTGAPNAITKNLYKKLKPTILSEMEMRDGNGVSNNAKTVIIDELTFGNVVFNQIPTVVIDSFMLLDCFKIDGFIGSNMLRNSVIQFLYSEEKLILTDNPTLLHLSENQASDIITDEQSGPYIEIGLLGNVEGGDFALFDTGFNGFYDIPFVKYDTLFRHYPIFKIENTGYGGNAMGLWGFNEAKLLNLSVLEMRINGTIFHNVSTRTATDDNSKIGHELLRYGKVTVDYINKKFYFEPYTTHIDLSKKEFPIDLKFEGNKLLIGTIWGDKYAQMIKVGDQIMSIDNVNCESINPCDWLIKGSLLDDKNKAELVVKTQAGTTVRIAMNRE